MYNDLTEYYDDIWNYEYQMESPFDTSQLSFCLRQN